MKTNRASASIRLNLEKDGTDACTAGVSRNDSGFLWIIMGKDRGGEEFVFLQGMVSM